MYFKDIIEQIEEAQDVPVWYRKEDEAQICGTVAYKTSTSTKKRGIYLPVVTCEEFYECTREKNPIEFAVMSKYIKDAGAEVNAYTFSAFNVLHEIGHWMHYVDFINDGHSDEEYIMKFERDRYILMRRRNVEYRQCKNVAEIERLNNKYAGFYHELCTEKAADQYASEHIRKIVATIL